jgi:ribosomal protein S30
VSKWFVCQAGTDTETEEKKLSNVEKIEKENKKIRPDSAHSEQPRQRNSQYCEARVLQVLFGVLVGELVLDV